MTTSSGLRWNFTLFCDWCEGLWAFSTAIRDDPIHLLSTARHLWSVHFLSVWKYEYYCNISGTRERKGHLSCLDEAHFLKMENCESWLKSVIPQKWVRVLGSISRCHVGNWGETNQQVSWWFVVAKFHNVSCEESWATEIQIARRRIHDSLRTIIL